MVRKLDSQDQGHCIGQKEYWTVSLETGVLFPLLQLAFSMFSFGLSFLIYKMVSIYAKLSLH